MGLGSAGGQPEQLKLGVLIACNSQDHLSVTPGFVYIINLVIYQTAIAFALAKPLRQEKRLEEKRCCRRQIALPLISYEVLLLFKLLVELRSSFCVFDW
jgi:hypothetical protein